MDWMDLVKDIFQLCILPLLVVLAKYVINFINIKANELKAKTENELVQKYIDMLNNTITSCVIATNQTYVDGMKDKNAFDQEAQQIAFNMTFNAVKELLTDDARKYLTEIYSDLNSLIATKIEAEVKLLK